MALIRPENDLTEQEAQKDGWGLNWMSEEVTTVPGSGAKINTEVARDRSMATRGELFCPFLRVSPCQTASGPSESMHPLFSEFHSSSMRKNT